LIPEKPRKLNVVFFNHKRDKIICVGLINRKVGGSQSTSKGMNDVAENNANVALEFSKKK
jgi:hypothetical protein